MRFCNLSDCFVTKHGSCIGVLPYFTISGKVFYRTKDVHEFIRTRFAEVEERAAKRKEKEARKEERRRKRGLFP